MGGVIAQILPAVDLASGQEVQRQTVYDAQGRRAQEIAEDGVITAFGYDVLGRMTSLTNDLGGTNQVVTTYAYDQLGRQTNQVDALGRATQYTYDILGRRTGRILPGNTVSEGYRYDVLGRLAFHTNFNGFIATNLYGGAGRMKELWVRPPGGSDTGIQTNYYDFAGRLTGRLDEAGTNGWLYNANGWLMTNAGPVKDLAYNYDSIGNLTNAATKSTYGYGVRYFYDPLGRLTNVLAGQNTAKLRSEYAYDALGRLGTNVLRVQGNGRVTNFYEYDARSRLTNISAANNSGTLLARFGYALSSTGQRVARWESGAAWNRSMSWKYDRLHRVTKEQVDSGAILVDPPVYWADDSSIWKYDAVGNRLQSDETVLWTNTSDGTKAPSYGRGFGYDANLDRLTSVTITNWGNSTNGAGTVSYDPAGNTTNFNGRSYRYDWANRLTNAVVNGNTLQFTYNADGQLVLRRVTTNGTTTTTGFVVDNRTLTGWPQVVENLTFSGGTWNLATSYAYGLSRFSQTHGSEYTYYPSSFYLHDALGSVRGLVDTGGTLTDAYDYDAWGRLISLRVLSNSVYIAVDSGHPATTNAFRFTGEQWEPQLGLYYLRARFYDPETGRFWTQDSYEGNQSDPLSLHKYLYCHANPVNMTDPSGHFGVGSGGIPELMSVQNIIGVMARAAVPTLVRIPGQIAARGFMKWAWISGGIGAGVATLMSDTDLGMEIQVGLRANPTGSAWAYKNEHCTDFAKDAEKVFRERGEAPQRITYDSFRRNTREGLINAK